MKLVYLNNFRGFKDSFVEIKDVNFFIGENSTGKTSVLKILRALLNTEFWTTADMDLSLTDLGYFHEITSDNNENSTFFEIGLFDEIEETGIKLKYSKEKGRPIISEVGFLSKAINAEFINLRSDLKFRYTLHPKIEKGQQLVNLFEGWIRKNELGSEKFIEVDKEEKMFNLNFPIFFTLLMQIQSVIRENKLTEFKPFYGKSIYWFAPIRTNPQRIYDAPNSEHSPDGAHTPFLLRDYLMSPGDDSAKEKKKRIEFILNKFGADSGLFESVSIKQYENSITSPFQLQIMINGRKLNFTNVGYGVSQILPLLVEIIVSPKNSIFSIQQPEVHLHPRGQAAFGDFLFKSFTEENKRFIIETHSDYLIDRFRIRLSKNARLEHEIKIESHVVFFSKGIKGNQMTSIPISIDGGLPDEQPKEYRNFFIREQFDLLDI